MQLNDSWTLICSFSVFKRSGRDAETGDRQEKRNIRREEGSNEAMENVSGTDARITDVHVNKNKKHIPRNKWLKVLV